MKEREEEDNNNNKKEEKLRRELLDPGLLVSCPQEKCMFSFSRSRFRS